MAGKERCQVSALGHKCNRRGAKFRQERKEDSYDPQISQMTGYFTTEAQRHREEPKRHSDGAVSRPRQGEPAVA